MYELNISIPSNNLIEREFIIDEIFNNFLGIRYNLEINDSEDNSIIRFDDKKLIVLDSLWKNNKKDLSYLNIFSLPSEIIYSNNPYIVEENIPILYGSTQLTSTNDSITCGIDIFASIFFMLTRWEEYVSLSRDSYGRFKGEDSIAHKHNFLHRPIVNEYIEMLWNMLWSLGFKGMRKKQNFELILTHDVDHISIPFLEKLLTFGGDLVKRFDLKKSLWHFTHLFYNPIDSFSFLMSVSESKGIKSRFYFKAKYLEKSFLGTTVKSKSRIITLIAEIKKRGHIIGFHPDIPTYTNEIKWKEERIEIEDRFKVKLIEGRQHYLMMAIPNTLIIWNNLGMEMDSTLGYHDIEGFRCGTGNKFHLFDFLNRKKLDLLECPLIVMDGTLHVYRSMSIEQARGIIFYYLSLGKKFSMPITLLFHNSIFASWERSKRMYKDILFNFDTI